MIIVFDVDGTLVEPWYGKDFPDFYRDEADAIMRSTFSDTYEYVKILPHVVYFISDCKTYFGENVDFRSLTTIVNGQEYVDKVEKITKGLPDIKIIEGVCKDEDKLVYLQYLADKDEVMYFDDSMSLLCKAEQLTTKCGILCFHSMSMLVRSPKELYAAFKLHKH